MTVAEFKQELASFLGALDEHRNLWRQSINNIVPSPPYRNTSQLRDQANRLNRHLGRLRPYIERFMPPQYWAMHVQATGTKWNALDMAVSAEAIAQIKGPSMQTVSERLHQLLGKLDGMSPTQDLNQASTAAKPRSLEVPAAQNATPPTSRASAPSASPPTPQAPPVATLEPVTLEQVSLRDLLSALGRLSVGAWLTILTMLAAIIGATITVTRSTDQGTISTLRDSVRMQQRSLDSLRAPGDSLAAVLTRPRRK